MKKPLVNSIIFLLLGALLSWGITWALPSKAVPANNIPKKEITCVLNYSHELYKKTINDDSFKIIYDDKEVEEPNIFSITITNTGDYSISNEDFKEPFSIKFPGCKGIIKANVTESTNKYVWDEVLEKATINGTELIFEDFFLNPQESFTLSIITNGKPEKVHHSFRIEGISKLKLINTTADKIEKLKRTSLIFIVATCSVVVVMIISSIAFWIVMKRKDEKFEQELLKSLEKTSEN